jgi:hypothetical protein
MTNCSHSKDSEKKEPIVKFRTRVVVSSLIAGMVTSLLAIRALPAEPPVSAPVDATQEVAEARGRAELLHTTYEALLITVHRAYFDGRARASVPARVFEDAFVWVDAETKGKTKWISVNTEPMNLAHKPKTKFEKEAARALASGEKDFEKIENGVYRRAAAISLVASCLRCHEAGPVQNRGRKRVAGLVISLPVK